MLDIHDAERQVIASVIVGLDEDVASKLLDWLEAADFALPDHRHLWWHIKRLEANSEPLDEYSLAASSELEHVNASALTQMTSEITSTANVEHWARMVKQASRARRAARTMRECADKVLASACDGDVLDSAIKQVAELDGNFRTRPPTMKGLIKELYDDIEARIRNGTTCFSTGVESIDVAMSGGLRPGEVMVVGGRPGTGKSSLALQMAWSAAKRGKSVWFASCEMSAKEILERVLSSELSIPSHKLRDPRRMNQDEMSRVCSAQQHVSRNNWHIMAYGAPTVARIKADALRHRAVHGLDCIVIDYMQLMSGEGKSLYERVSDVSKSIKALALDLDVPIIALAQLRRSDNNSPPTMADLRDSGQIEQDADIVALLHKPKDSDGCVEVLFDKQRAGVAGISVTLRFVGATYTFYHPKEAPPRYNFA